MLVDRYRDILRAFVLSHPTICDKERHQAGVQAPEVLPETVHTGASTWGLVFFAGLDEVDMSLGWQLVIDLSEHGFEPVRFNLPTE